jgi:hypothetical protein
MELFLSRRTIIFVIQLSFSFFIGESQGVKWREVRLLSSEGRVKLNCIFHFLGNTIFFAYFLRRAIVCFVGRCFAIIVPW